MSPTDSHSDRLRAYYEDTWFDYRFLWLDPRTRAMHFGYDAGNGVSHADALLKLNDEMAARVGLRTGDRVLDAGCGVGGTAFWLTEQRDADVVGVNLVQDHIDRARRYVTERGLGDRPRFEVRDYANTGFDAGTFDVIWATESACHAPDKQPFATEAMRLLRPGGRIVMAEYLTIPGLSGIHPQIKKWEHGWEMTLKSEAEWTATLRNAGFADLKFDDVTTHMRASLDRLRRLCLGLSTVARVLHLVKVRTAAQQRNISGSLAMGRALDADAWYYAIVTATKPQS